MSVQAHSSPHEALNYAHYPYCVGILCILFPTPLTRWVVVTVMMMIIVVVAAADMTWWPVVAMVMTMVIVVDVVAGGGDSDDDGNRCRRCVGVGRPCVGVGDRSRLQLGSRC